jgi:hypothetical protein
MAGLFRRIIDINAADNGVVLAGAKHHGRGLHSFEAIQAVADRLRAAQGQVADRRC